MTDSAASRHIHIPHWTQRYGMGAFLVIILVGAVYSISSLTTDLVEEPSGSNILVFLLLGVALLSAFFFFSMTRVSLMRYMSLRTSAVLAVGTAASEP